MTQGTTGRRPYKKEGEDGLGFLGEGYVYNAMNAAGTDDQHHGKLITVQSYVCNGGSIQYMYTRDDR